MRQSREQATVGRTHASMSVGGHALPLHPLILKWLHPLPPHTHTYTHTTTTTPPPLPQSSQVVQSAALFAGMKSETEAVCCLVCITYYDHIYVFFYFTNNLSSGFLSLLCYIVCVCALLRPKIRNKILASFIFIQFRLDQQRTKLC